MCISPGEFVSIVGPSGCGKSTLLRVAAGLIAPSSGTFQLAETATQSHRQRVAFVFQDPTLLPWRSVTGNVRLPLELTGSGTGVESLVAETVNLVGLSDQDVRKRPAMLSGGMRMRVSLARALVTRPDILLMDEPFAALDDLLRQQLNEELLRVCRSNNRTTLFVTHNVSEAVFLSDRVLIMSAGPGTILCEMDVPFAYPRTAELRSQPEFARLTGEIASRLRGTAE